MQVTTWFQNRRAKSKRKQRLVQNRTVGFPTEDPPSVEPGTSGSSSSNSIISENMPQPQTHTTPVDAPLPTGDAPGGIPGEGRIFGRPIFEMFNVYET